MGSNFSHLNDKQLEAVKQTDGPLLILAGAGSGKTTVLINRIANIIESGLALPWQVLAITFTNKAAGELKERLEKALGAQSSDIWAFTFHSCCTRILRRFADRLGYTSSFTIYDTDDSKRVVKQCQNDLDISDKHIGHKAIMNEISVAKDSLVTPEEFKNTVGSDFRLKKIAEVYEAYQNRLKSANAMDFDDIIFNTVKLLRENKDVLELYQNQFKYILVDEYQDTNHAQYILTSLLAEKHKNICVVGDDDQSIYSFRGATIENILSFEKQYPNAKVIRLEQNYRSLGNILGAANAVIANNSQRKGKNLWTANDSGEPVVIKTCMNETDESRFIADTILANAAKGIKMGDHAVLYRMRAQSASIERTLVKSGIPYRMIGGHRFFERMEIKDLVSYLAVVNNTADDVRLQRIINVPRRGIGNTTLSNVMKIAAGLNLPFFEVIKRADEFEALSRCSAKLTAFAKMIEEFVAVNEAELGLNDLLNLIIEKTEYKAHLELDKESYDDRMENVQELSSILIKYDMENVDGDLSSFLEEVALMSDTDNYDENEDAVVLMTIHSAKGLEFPVVFVPGMEEGIFPGSQSIYDSQATEEERRLAYVAYTRAEKQLYLLSSNQRMLFGQTSRNPVSRFVKEIPSEFADVQKAQLDEGSFTGSTLSQASYSGRTFIPQPSTKAPATRGFGQYVAQEEQNVKSYKAGDVVRHKTFGTGIILNVTPMGNDHLLEIAFDTVGTKKLMAKFAKLETV